MKTPSNLQAFVDSTIISDPIISEMFREVKGYSAKDQEIDAVKVLIKELKNYGGEVGTLSYFYLNYQIPQISKEFDLLRFGKEYNLNIELKSNQSVEKIKKQQIQNNYYLSALGKQSIHITFESDNKVFYMLENEEIVKISPHKVIELIDNQVVEHIDNIDKLFEPSCYLINPFRTDDKFVNGNYFLNGQQEQFKSNILSKKFKKYRITGKPGTGKSLLTYDIAKEFINEGQIVSIIHAGKLNRGHEYLNDNHNWKIYPALDLKEDRFSLKLNPDVIIIDEAQRLYVEQFKKVEQHIEDSDKEVTLIISYDVEQILADWESETCLSGILKLSDRFSEYKTFELKTKIRTNPELSKFIQGMFDLRKMQNVTSLDNIAIQYFQTYNDAHSFAKRLGEENWKIIDYTVPMWNDKGIGDMAIGDSEEKVHQVIGQEFDKVIAIVGKDFYYEDEKFLRYSNKNYYDAQKMLYQIITRVRKNLMLIIVDNEELLGHLISSMLINLKENQGE